MSNMSMHQFHNLLSHWGSGKLHFSNSPAPNLMVLLNSFFLSFQLISNHQKISLAYLTYIYINNSSTYNRSIWSNLFLCFCSSFPHPQSIVITVMSNHFKCKLNHVALLFKTFQSLLCQSKSHSPNPVHDFPSSQYLSSSSSLIGLPDVPVEHCRY